MAGALFLGGMAGCVILYVITAVSETFNGWKSVSLARAEARKAEAEARKAEAKFELELERLRHNIKA